MSKIMNHAEYIWFEVKTDQETGGDVFKCFDGSKKKTQGNKPFATMVLHEMMIM